MRRDDDVDLRERFARLRGDDQQRVPPFASVLAGRGIHRYAASAALLRVVVVAAGVVLAALIFRAWSAPNVEADFAHPRAHWRAPTDFLLDVPGGDMLRTIPSFGWSPRWPTGLIGSPGAQR